VTNSFIFKILQAIGEDPKWANYMKGYQEFVPEWYEKGEDGETCFRQELEKIGFKINHIQTLKKTYYSPNFEVMLDFYLSLNPYILTIPKNLHADLREDYRRHFSSFYNLSVELKSLNSRYEMLVCSVEKK